MKFKNILTVSALSFGLAAGAVAQTPPAPAPAAAPAAEPAAPAPQFTEAQALEAYGWYIGKSNGLAELEFTQAQVESLIKGMMIAREGKESPYELQKIGPEIDKLLRAKQEKYSAMQKEKSAAEAEKLFTEVKKNPKVVALPSGLLYEIVQAGAGEYPKPTDMVKVHYTGTLVNGTVFDTSLQPRQPGAAVEPAEFQLDQVIPGWTEGLQKINKGGKIKLYIPSALGYGEAGQGSIPPSSTLIFDVELIDVKPAPAAAPMTDIPPPPAAPPAAK